MTEKSPGWKHKLSVAEFIKALMSSPKTSSQLTECGFGEYSCRIWMKVFRQAGLVRLGPYIRQPNGRLKYTYFWDPGGKDEIRPPKFTQAQLDKRCKLRKVQASELEEDVRNSVPRTEFSLQDVWMTRQGKAE